MKADIFGEDIFGSFFGGSWQEPPDIVPMRILGLTERPENQDAVRAAFRSRLLAVHPDVNAYAAVPELQAAADATAAERPEVTEVIWARNVLLRKIPTVTDNDVTQERHDYPSPPLCKKCSGERRDSQGEPYRRVGLNSSADLKDWQRQCGYKGRPPKPWDGYCWPCAEDAKNEQQRERRRQARAGRACAADNCDVIFTPPRADGRYCSPACRQKAYRRRQAS